MSDTLPEVPAVAEPDADPDTLAGEEVDPEHDLDLELFKEGPEEDESEDDEA